MLPVAITLIQDSSKAVTLDINGVPFPVTREDVLKILFGDEFVLTPKGDVEPSRLAWKPLPKKRGPKPKPLSKLSAKKRAAPNKNLPEEIIKILNGDAKTRDQVLALYEKAYPGKLSRHKTPPAKQMEMALSRLELRGRVKVAGKGSSKLWSVVKTAAASKK